MKKPLFTDRTKLYIGGYMWYERGTITLGVCIDNASKLIKDFENRIFIAPNGGTIERPSSLINLIDSPLTLSKLADEIRATKADGYSHLIVSGLTLAWAKHTPEGLIVANGSHIKDGQTHYCCHPVESFTDWREALPILMKRLNKRLQEVRSYGKTKRLEYTAFVDGQTAIDKAQAIEIRSNNKRFKGIPY